MSKISVAGFEAEPGRRVTGVASISIDGHDVAVPVIAVAGAHDGPRVAVTAGIHGAEYVCIEAARRVGMSVDPAQLHGSLVVVPIVNTTSYHRRSIYTSGLDGENLNRMFPGDAHGHGSKVLAAWLVDNIIAPSQFYIDMHGGDMIEALMPFVLAPMADDQELHATSLAMAKASGIIRVIRGGVAGSTVGAAVAAGVPSILSEMGGQGVWSDELATAHADSTMYVLRHLGLLPGEVPAAPDQAMYTTFAWMRADATGLFHPRVAVGDRVTEGQNVGAIVDYFGETLQTLEAVATGEVTFIVTSLAMNAGDPILAICA